MEYGIGADEPVSGAVVRAVSAVEGREPLSLPPLGNVLDTDALDALFADRSNGTPRTGGRISFVYSNCRLTVDNGEYHADTPRVPAPRGAYSSRPQGTTTGGIVTLTAAHTICCSFSPGTGELSPRYRCNCRSGMGNHREEPTGNRLREPGQEPV